MATKSIRGKSWVISFADPQTGKQVRRVIGSAAHLSESDAETTRQAVEYELATGANTVLNLIRPKLETLLWSEFALRYLQWRSTEFSASRGHIEMIFDKHFAVAFGRLYLDDITKERGEAYVRDRTRRVSLVTVGKELQTLKAALNKAVEWGLLPANAIAKVHAPRDVTDEPVVFYTAEELARLYAVASPRNAAIWKLFVNTGMRRSEALQLKWSDVSATAITVRSTDTARTKSGRWRHIPVSPGCKDALGVLQRTSDYVLPRITKHALTRQFKRDLRKAKLKGNLHQLRHTFASHLVMAGRPLYEVKTLLGHASINTTEIYAHLAPDHLQAAVQGMNL